MRAYRIEDLKDQLVLAEADSLKEAARILQAYVATAPGREDELVVREYLSGQLIRSLDIFDIS